MSEYICIDTPEEFYKKKMGACCGKPAAASNANADAKSNTFKKLSKAQIRRVVVERGAKLKFITLDNQGMKDVPRVLTTEASKSPLCDTLVTLSLKNNQLTAFPYEVVGSLRALKTLKLQGNVIRSMMSSSSENKATFTCESLRTLNMSRNALEGELAGSWVQCMPGLTELVVSYNRLTHVTCRFTRLEVLDLSFNRLVDVQGLAGMVHLRTLKLEHNKLKQLPDVFANMKALSLVDVSHNHLNTLPVSLLRDSAVQTIALEDNPFCQGQRYYKFEGFSDYESRGKARADKGVAAGLGIHTM
jgi:Leucine-rich repeat (LRR) protein